MNYILAQIFVCLLIAALLGMLIGWLLCKSKCNDKSETNETKNKTQTKETGKSKSPNEVAKKDMSFVNTNTDKYNESTKDNLQLIKGVGATLEKVLNDIGIYKFEQIASWTPEQSAQVDEIIAFPGRIEREKWVSQCKKLQNGHSTEFSKRVEKGKVPTSKA